MFVNPSPCPKREPLAQGTESGSSMRRIICEQPRNIAATDVHVARVRELGMGIAALCLMHLSTAADRCLTSDTTRFQPAHKPAGLFADPTCEGCATLNRWVASRAEPRDNGSGSAGRSPVWSHRARLGQFRPLLPVSRQSGRSRWLTGRNTSWRHAASEPRNGHGV